MKKKLLNSKSFILTFVIVNLFFVNTAIGQAVGDYRAVATGTWTTLTTWQRLNALPSTWVTPTVGQGYPGQIAGTGNVLIQNTFTVTLDVDPANAIGSLTVGGGASGTLTIGNGNADRILTITGNVIVNAAATLNTAGNGGNTLNIGGNLTVAGTFDMNIGGADLDVTFNGTNQTISGAGLIDLNALTFTNNGTATLGVALPGIAGALTVNAGTTLDMSTFSIGATTPPSSLGLECGGTVAASITGSGTLSLGGNVNVTDATTGTLGASIGVPIALVGATRTFTVADDGTSATDLSISGVISGSFGITKAGAGIMDLSGLNTYTGISTIAAGTLSINTLHDVSGGASSLGAPVTTGNGTIAMSGGATVLQYTGAATSSNRAIATGGNGPTIDASGSGLLTLTGGITGGNDIVMTGTGLGTESGAIATGGGSLFTKNGAGTWTLSGLNTFTGATTINAGVLSVGTIGDGGTNGNLGGAAAIGLNGGTLQYTGATASTNRTVALTGTASGIEVTVAANNLTISGVVSGAAAGYHKAGLGTLTMSGANSYTGPTVIDAGILSVATINAVAGTGTSNLGTSTAANPAANMVIGNGTLQYTGLTATTNRAFTIAGTVAPFTTVDITTANNLTVTGAVTSTCTRFIKAGIGTLTRSTTASTFTGDLVIAAGTFATDQNTSVAGNWTNNGTFTVTGGTVSFNGISAQTIGGTSATTFNGLTINNSAGVSLTTVDATVNAALTLTLGNLTIPTGRLLTITSGTAIAGSPFSAAKSIVTQSNSGTGAQGFVRVNIPQAAVYTIPTSDGTNYLPVILTPTEALITNNSYRVGVFQGITTTGVPSVVNAFTAGQKNTCVDAVWTVNYNGAGSPSTTMRVEWPLSLEGTKFQGFSTIGIAHYGPSWGIPAGSGAHGTPNFATLAGITAFSPFGVGNPAFQVLATKITYFNAAKGNGYNTVNWQAACSSSEATFEVLRSTDGRNFTSINSLTASQARCAQPFNFQDNTAPQGIVYYRLKVIDIDGKETLSGIVKLSSEIKNMELAGIAPNPVANTAQLKFNASKADVVNLTIISTEGQVVYRNSVTVQPGSSIVNLDIAKLPSGVYMIKGMFSDGETNTVKFLKQ